MSIENLNNAVAALNAATARVTAFMDEVDADLAAHQAAYETLSTDLVNSVEGVVATGMTQTIQWLPGAGDTNAVNGGHVRTWAEAKTFIAAAPSGSRVIIEMDDGVHVVDSGLSSFSHLRRLIFQGVGTNVAGSRPLLQFAVTEAGGVNSIPSINLSGSAVVLNSIDIDLGTEAAPGGGFNANDNGFKSSGVDDFSLLNSQVVGDAPKLLEVAGEGVPRVTLKTVDAVDVTLVSNSGGAAVIATFGMSLTGTAALHSGFTLGTNLLEA